MFLNVRIIPITPLLDGAVAFKIRVSSSFTLGVRDINERVLALSTVTVTSAGERHLCAYTHGLVLFYLESHWDEEL